MNISKLYIDNFREFYDTVIPLQKVNFLVGENSTGKTSLLKLIDLISSPEFWFNGNFRTDNVDFSYFGDISSTSKGDSNQTKIGVLYENEDDNNNTVYSALLITVAAGPNKRTILKDIRCSFEGKELSIQVRKRISYKYTSETSFSFDNFGEWCNEKIDSTGYTRLKKEPKLYMDDSPYFIINSLSRKHENNDDTSVPPFVNTVAPYTWIAPIRIKPQLTYDGNVYDYSSDGAHAPYILKTIMSKRGNNHTKKIVAILEKFGKESGLFDSVYVKQFAKYGNSPFSIEVVKDGVEREITNVGYGVSQVLPIVIEILDHSNYRFAIQQPEVHLHPKAQASLGNFFFDIAVDYQARFVIETHSDFVIDRFRQQIAKSKNPPITGQVLFLEHKDGKNIVYCINVNSDGSYSENQPDSFRRFFFNEELKNITL